MTKKDFVRKFEKLVFDYCRNNNDYEDVEDLYDYSFRGGNFAVSLTILSENYQQEYDYDE